MPPLRLVALLTLCAAAVSVRAEDESAPAPFRSVVGLTCASRADCGFLPGLACVNAVCDYCVEDADCSGPGEVLRRCNRIETLDAETKKLVPLSAANARGDDVAAAFCVEKDLFHPFTANDVVATLLAFIATALGSGCGVGGGGLLVPAFILVIGLSPKHAIPLSKATIFGNAAAIYMFNLRRKHPIKKNVPVINYDVASIMEPTTLIGSIFGVVMNHVLPNWLILVLLVSLLSYTTHKTFLKGNKIRNKETTRKTNLLKLALKGRKDGGGRGRAWSIYRTFDWQIAARKWLTITRRNRRLRELQREDEEDFASLPPLLSEMPQSAVTLLATKDGASTPGKNVQKQSDDDSTAEIRQRLARREADIFPLRVIVPLFAAWLVVFMQALLRGGHGAPSVVGVRCNSFEYWFLTMVPVVVLLLITWRVGHRLRLDNRLRVVSGYEFLESDIHWTWRNVTVFPLYCISAGVAAGLLGIGGGMVKGPIMLEMGVLPPVQSVTASYMILYTASSTTLQFAIAGQFPGTLQYDYVAWFAFVGFVGGLCGQQVVAFLVKKYKRESIMVFILAVTIGLSTCAMGFIGLRNTAHDLQRGGHMGFSSLCGSE